MKQVSELQKGRKATPIATHLAYPRYFGAHRFLQNKIKKIKLLANND